MTTQVTFLLYLLYGFFYILMGVVILQQRNQELSGFPLLKILPLVGLFGITHGLSEWLTMAQIAGIYEDLNPVIFTLKGIMKAVSFYFLLRFALLALPGSTLDRPGRNTFRSMVEKIPMILLAAWFFRFGFLYFTEGIGYLEENRVMGVIIKRYLMCFPAGVIGSIALFISGKKIQRMNYGHLHRWYYGLGASLFVYGLLDGIFVRKMDFFPASIINNRIFYDYTGVPIQILKIVLGILLTYFVVQISKVFEGEKKALIDRMMKDRAVEVEREKMNREIHDRIIQKMYGAGLKIEAFLGKENREVLLDANKDLQEGIREARNIISNTMIKDYHSKDLEGLVKDVIRSVEKDEEIELIFENRVPTLHLGKISKESATQIYYILQEAVTNAAKHSGATKILVRLTGEYDRLTMEIEDNGTGFDPERYERKHPLMEERDSKNPQKLGLEIMKERALEIGGNLDVKSRPSGTRVRLDLQWGGEIHGKY